MDIISCNEVIKKFNDFTALDRVTLSVKEGSIFGLLGPNGAGKTTLIRIINQITLPDSGQLLYRGRAAVREDIAHIGYLPEERGLYKKMKVGEQALYLAQLKGLSHQEAMKGLKEWFVKFGIQAWWNKKVEELSKGMAQKVQFITTVLHRPSLLILDEPFSGFDPVNVQLIRNEILKMKSEGASIILSTHNMESVEELCDDIALINKAKLITSGSLDQIRRNHGKDEIEIIYRATDSYNFASVRGVLSVKEESLKEGRRALVELEKGYTSKEILSNIVSEVDIFSFRELIPRMNDIFINLVS